MNARRYLCSELVTLSINSVRSIVNLEEICRDGAVVESEDAVEVGVVVKMECGDVVFVGRAIGVERHEFGWRVDVAFSPFTPWSRERFEPGHLLEV